AIVVGTGIIITQRITAESDDIRSYATSLLNTANTQLDAFPDWAKPTINDLLFAFKKGYLLTPASILPYFPQAISRIVSIVIFIFSGFYLLKDGESGIEWLVRSFPKEFRDDLEEILKSISAVLNG